MRCVAVLWWWSLAKRSWAVTSGFGNLPAWFSPSQWPWPLRSFVCDYSNPKYPAGTCYLKDLRTYAFPPIDPEALDPANVAAQNEEMIKVVRRNPRDYTFIETIFMHDKNKLTRNFVFNAKLFIKGR
ncbi:MYND-type domain-containing protein [Mycena chlorophos]|uniref:MYND-type domain-containing protein n=1 Tax=Mycena chlorophos TaxID=658473 RepID=A0A8H6VWB5_MYCCL|nr:MYND-type domain-containing protein [Mycena chlorophos]